MGYSSKNLFVYKSLIFMGVFLIGWPSYGQKQTATSEIPEVSKQSVVNSSIACFYKGKTEQKIVALTFDDGPTEVSRQVVQILDEYEAKGTFFWLGKNLFENKDFAKQTSEKHLLASHSWDHTNGFQSTIEELWNTQVQKTNLEFEKIGLGSPAFYRPPYGAITQEQMAFLTEQGISTILWSITTLDWDTTRNSSEELFNRFVSEIQPGAIVLMHDRGFNDEGQNMLSALRRILDYGKSNGYQFVTIEELVK